MKIGVLLACMCLCGCLHRRTQGVNYVVDGKTCHAVVRLIDCNHSSPPTCRWIAAKYDRNCEMIDLTK
jgi:hypothetical protein